MPHHCQQQHHTRDAAMTPLRNQVLPPLIESSARSTNTSEEKERLRTRIKIMFSAYRLDQYPDPDGFMLQALAVLSEYPAEVVHYVTDPRTGLQRTQTFPPTI